MAPTLRTSRTTAAVFAAATLALSVQVLAADCDGNGIEDAIDVEPSGPGYRLVRKLGLPATDLALADMNADGSVDVVALSAAQVTVALGESGWRWTVHASAAVSADHDLLIVEDLDRDGHPDVVVAGPPGISFLFNLGKGDLERGSVPDAPIGSTLNDIEASDVDGDGWTDLVTWNRLRNISVVRNAGGRRFEAPRNYASVIQPLSRADALASGDLDRDGHPDLALVRGSHVGRGTMAVLWNDGRGGYFESSVSTMPWLTLLGYADIDADGHGDLLVASAGVLLALRNDGGRVLSQVVLSSESIDGPVLIEDLDLDGIPEMTISRTACAEIVVLARAGESFVESTMSSLRVEGSLADCPRAADVDGDGDMDLAVFEWGGIHLLSREPALAPADCNANGIPDSCEDDCNGNAVPDACDIATGESRDCDANAVPDDCETDCNGNGISDACEVRDGSAEDCNGNGVPDGRDVSDSNQNGVPDPCEIASGEAPDCNGNGVLDGFEVVPGLLAETLESPGPAVFLSQADMDSDGHPDLLVRRSGGETEIVSRDGSAGMRLSARAMGIRAARDGNYGESLAALDVDADADLDLALLGLSGDCAPRKGLFVAESLGSGRFRSVWSHRFERLFPQSILAGDFDGDGRPDIVAWAIGWYLWLFRGVPGGLEEPTLLFLDQALEFCDVAPIDVDSDGDLDLAANTGLIFANPGDGALKPSGRFPAEGTFVVVGDLGGDGLEDVLTGGILAENEGAGRFRQRRLTGETVLGGAAGDFDGDGLEDAILGMESGMALYLRRGAGFAESRPGLPLYSTLEVMDLDRDGRLDLAGLYADAVLVHPNVSDPPFADTGRRTGDGFVSALESADLDGDGDMDLAATVLRDGNRPDLSANEILSLEAWMNEGPGSPHPETLFELGPGSFPPFAPGMAASDLDGDGDVDFALPSFGEFILLERGAGGRLLRVDPGVALAGGPRHVLADDMDRDGAGDLVIQNEAGQVFVLFGKRWPAFDAAPVVTAVSFGVGLLAGDLDGDGNPDLVASRLAGILPIANLGGRTFSLLPPVSPAGGLEAVAIADFDGDGDLDLAASHCIRSDNCREESLLTLFRNDSLGHFGDPVSRHLHHHSQDLEAVDIDGDGDDDLVAAEGRSSRADSWIAGSSVEVFLGEGAGLGSWAHVRLGVTPGPIAIGDFDGDAVRDLAVGSGNGVAFLPLRLVPPSGPDADGDGVLDSCAGASFRRGDWNSDSRLDLTDAVSLLGRLFLGGEATGCDDSGDADDNGRLDLADPLRILRHLFQGDPPPPAPHDACGEDPTADDLSCVRHPDC